MAEYRRPDPEEILAKIRSAEPEGAGASLKIFFGMCAGVGKTYAMLEEARSARAGGIDVVVATAETHGRPETEALLEGLPRLRPRTVNYRGVELEELDVDAIVERRPAIVLVDELAHTNAPGSRHAKRWQDVQELLERGITVWTAINVQHIESLADVVEDLSGVQVRERVPDTVIDRADEIRLIDAAPEELRRRLAEGKVYTGDASRIAADNFFRARNLGALREMALRYAARTAERRLRAYARVEASLGPRGYGEGVILVGVGPSPSSANLVRWARRSAYALRSSWVAVHVDDGRVIRPDEAVRLEANLALARKLGAETIVVQASGIAEAIVDTAHSRGASMIVIGRSGLSRLGFLPHRPTVSDRIVRDAGPVDVVVVQDTKLERGPPHSGRVRRFFAAPPREYAAIAAVFALITGAGWFLTPIIGHRAMSFIYLAAILGLSFVARPGPLAGFAVLSALTLDYLFIEPRFTLYINTVEDILLFAIYFLVAFVTGSLVARLRANSRILEERETRTSFLLRAAERLAECRTAHAAADEAAALAREHFETEASVFVAMEDIDAQAEGEVLIGDSGWEDRDRAAAEWSFRERRIAGSGSDTLASARYRCFPVSLGERSAGVIALVPPEGHPWRFSDDVLMLSLAHTLALVVERERSEARSRAAALELESERLSTVLLDTVSHELRTPLTTITGSLSALKDEDLAKRPGPRRDLVAGALDAAGRLDRIVEDILSMSRLESGALRLSLEVVDLVDLANDALEGARPAIADRRVDLVVAEDARPVRVDAALVARLGANLLRNAARYSIPASPVTFALEEEGRDFVLRVRDRGPGVPDAELETIFERFKRGGKVPAGGLGLGLAICRGIALAHGGTIEARNLREGGFEVRALFPSCVVEPSA